MPFIYKIKRIPNAEILKEFIIKNGFGEPLENVVDKNVTNWRKLNKILKKVEKQHKGKDIVGFICESENETKTFVMILNGISKMLKIREFIEEHGGGMERLA